PTRSWRSSASAASCPTTSARTRSTAWWRSASSRQSPRTGAFRRWTKTRGRVLPPFDPLEGVTVTEPPGKGRGYWAGAPSARYDAAGGRFLLCYRLRRPLTEGRGYRCVIAASRDGVSFEEIWAVSSAEWGTPSIERSALVPDPAGGWR